MKQTHNLYVPLSLHDIARQIKRFHERQYLHFAVVPSSSKKLVSYQTKAKPCDATTIT
jgi:hypothetical protein